MIQNRSMLNITDNSGAKKAMVIGIPRQSNQKFARIGDIVTVTIKKASSMGIVKESEIVKVLVVRTRKENRRGDGSYVRFDDNAGVVIDTSGNPKGTRVFGPIAREIREKGYMKIISLAQEVV